MTLARQRVTLPFSALRQLALSTRADHADHAVQQGLVEVDVSAGFHGPIHIDKAEVQPFADHLMAGPGLRGRPERAVAVAPHLPPAPAIGMQRLTIGEEVLNGAVRVAQHPLGQGTGDRRAVQWFPGKGSARPKCQKGYDPAHDLLLARLALAA